MPNLYQYTVYKPAGGNALVNSKRQNLYTIYRNQILDALVNTYLIDTTWVSKMTWKNDTDVTQTFTHTYSTDFMIMSGGEVDKGYSLAEAFRRISVTIEGQEKTFHTTERRTIAMTLSVPPRSSLIFYQKRYRFKDLMSFVLKDDQLQAWKVSMFSYTAYAWKECVVEIMSEDYATLTDELDGTQAGTINVKTVDPLQGPSASKGRAECPEQCNTKLAEMLVD